MPREAAVRRDERGAFGRGRGLVPAEALLRAQELTVEIRLLEALGVGDGDLARAEAQQVFREIASEPSAAGDQQLFPPQRGELLFPERASLDRALCEGDVVGFFFPVSGG